MNQRLLGIGLLLVRVMTGVIFLVHGLQKFQGLEGTAGFFSSIGIPGPLAPVVAAIEALGGLALILGLGTRFAGAALTVIIIGALLTAKLGQPYLSLEFDLIVLFASLQQALVGSGRYGLDAMLFRKKSTPEISA